VANPAAVIPLTFDSVDIQFADFGIFLEIREGLNEPAQVRGVDIIVPGADGRVARNRRKDTRRVVLAGWVMGNGTDTATARSNYRSNVETIETLFALDAAPAVLVATLENGVQKSLNARTLNVIYSPQIASELDYLTIELEAVGPDWAVGSITLTPTTRSLVLTTFAPTVS